MVCGKPFQRSVLVALLHPVASNTLFTVAHGLSVSLSLCHAMPTATPQLIE